MKIKIHRKRHSPPLKQITYSARLWLLFSTFFKIALFVVGGGLAMLPVIERTFVRRRMLTTKDTLDMVILTQTVPGLVSVNSAVFVGTKVAGFLGAVSALCGVILPSVIIITIIAVLFPNLTTDNTVIQGAFTGIRAGVTAVLCLTLLRLSKKIISNKWDILLVGTALILLLSDLNPIFIIIGAMPLGIIYLYIENYQKSKKNLLKNKENKK